MLRHLGYEGEWFFQSKAFREMIDRDMLTAVELKTVHRQTDPRLTLALDRVREGYADEAALRLFNTRVGQPSDPERTLTLSPFNASVNRINNRRLERLDTPAYTHHAVLDGNWDSYTKPAPATLTLKPGMRVMTVNNDKNGQWVNGSTGTLEQVVTIHSNPVALITLDARDGEPEQHHVAVGINTWESYIPILYQKPDGTPAVEKRSSAGTRSCRSAPHGRSPSTKPCNASTSTFPWTRRSHPTGRRTWRSAASPNWTGSASAVLSHPPTSTPTPSHSTSST